MIKLNFYPESDTREFIEATAEYQQIWAQEGHDIVKVLKDITGLSFREKEIDAVIFEGPGHSSPLRLAAALSMSDKKAHLIHELCHRLAKGNNLKQVGESNNQLLENHKRIFLFLYDALVELYGQDLADMNVARESAIAKPEYKEAWQWALEKTSEQRRASLNALKVS